MPRFRVKGQYFPTAEEAVVFARQKAKDSVTTRFGVVVPVWDNQSNVTIAVITDDANGLTVHRLETWPKDEPFEERGADGRHDGDSA